MMSYFVSKGPAGIPVRRMFLIAGSLAAIALVGAEVAARFIGLHTPVLYEATSYGYRVKPDQELKRFGNRVFINAQGLRSEPISPVPAPGVHRVLCIGDSITNGGAITDQDDTYPYQLQRLLVASGRPVEVLNASAPGWAIANAAGWLQDNGILHSRVVMLTLGTLDLFQPRAGAEMVGGHPSFPGRAPVLALQNLVTHYLVPRVLRRSVADPGTQPSAQSVKDAKENIALLLSMAELVTKSDATPFVLYIEQPGEFEMTDPYTTAAKALLFAALQQRGIQFANSREPVERAGGVALFRDGLHPNAEGNLLLARAAYTLLTSVVSGMPLPTR